MPGKGGNAGGATSRAVSNPAARPKAAAESGRLPKGVKRRDNGNDTTYSFKVGGEKVLVTLRGTYVRGGGIEQIVEFVVGGGYSKGRLEGKNADAVALKLLAIMKHDAKTRPDGWRYSAGAYIADQFGASRALAYQAAGFSRPMANKAGGPQFAVVRNGRIRPNPSALEAEEKLRGYVFNQADYDALRRQRKEEKARR